MEKKLKYSIKKFVFVLTGCLQLNLISSADTIAGVDVLYYEPTGENLKTVESGSDGGWATLYNIPYFHVNSKTKKDEGPYEDEKYCHSYEIIEGVNTFQLYINNICVHLPRWTAPCQVEQDEWDRFLQIVITHETGHINDAKIWNNKQYAGNGVLGKAAVSNNIYAETMIAYGDTATVAKNTADELYMEFEKSIRDLVKKDINRMKEIYHQENGATADPNRNIECDS